MARSVWKQSFPKVINISRNHPNYLSNSGVERVLEKNFIDQTHLLKKKNALKKADLKGGIMPRIYSRSMLILPIHLNKEYRVYNGSQFFRVKVVPEMLRHKFGEFCFTKKTVIHKFNKNKQVSRKNRS